MQHVERTHCLCSKQKSSEFISLARPTLHRKRKGLIMLKLYEMSSKSAICCSMVTVVLRKMLTAAKHIVMYICYSTITSAIYKERGSHWSWQHSATVTTRWLQCDQTLPLPAKGGACEIHNQLSFSRFLAVLMEDSSPRSFFTISGLTSSCSITQYTNLEPYCTNLQI